MDQFKLFYKSLTINLSYKFFKTIEKELICLVFEINRDNGLIFFSTGTNLLILSIIYGFMHFVPMSPSTLTKSLYHMGLFRGMSMSVK